MRSYSLVYLLQVLHGEPSMSLGSLQRGPEFLHTQCFTQQRNENDVVSMHATYKAVQPLRFCHQTKQHNFHVCKRPCISQCRSYKQTHTRSCMDMDTKPIEEGSSKTDTDLQFSGPSKVTQWITGSKATRNSLNTYGIVVIP